MAAQCTRLHAGMRSASLRRAGSGGSESRSAARTLTSYWQNNVAMTIRASFDAAQQQAAAVRRSILSWTPLSLLDSKALLPESHPSWNYPRVPIESVAFEVLPV